MFYFEEDQVLEKDQRNRLSSVSSRASIQSSKSSASEDGDLSKEVSKVPTAVELGVTPTPPIATPHAPPQKLPVKKQRSAAGSPNIKRGRTRRETFSRSFNELYKLSDRVLGSGAYAQVRTCTSILTGKQFAVKIIEKHPGHSRGRVIKEIETFNLCKGHPNIVQLEEFFEEHDKFYLIFEEMRGGPLLAHIQRRGFFDEREACRVTRDLANALKYLHEHGVAHRDVKPENVLCESAEHVSPVKLCDLDLASKANNFVMSADAIKTPELRSPVGSAEFMAPEVVDAFVGDALTYDKRCDMWSLGVIVYIMLCGYPPFYGECRRQNCGWNEGEHCNDCQESLFHRIQRGEFSFPDKDWESISHPARDLIQRLLVKDAKKRLTADQVLQHPWLSTEPPKTPLLTAEVLLRKDSMRDLQQIRQNFTLPPSQFNKDELPTAARVVTESPSLLHALAIRNNSRASARSSATATPFATPPRSCGSSSGIYLVERPSNDAVVVRT